MRTPANRWSHFRLVLLSWSACALGGCMWSPPRHPAPPFDPDRHYRPLEVVSHRGCHRQAPENTYAAARRCIELGVEWVEVDVRRSRDGVYFLMHDITLDRTTDGKGRLDRRSAAEIDRLDAGSWFGPEFAGEKVPRLDEYLRWIRGRARVYIDAKVPDARPLVELVRRLDMDGEVFFWFGRDKKERQFRQLAPDIALMTNAYSAEAVYKARENYRADIVETELEWISEELVAACRETGTKLMVFVGGADRDRFARAILWGADMINLDDPEVFLDVQRNFFTRLEK